MNVLDIYVLSMLDRGCNTPYDLQHQAGLSQGAAIPSLRRLTAANLVQKAEEESATKRPRHRYTLTAKGRSLIRNEARLLLAKAEPGADMDTILRHADMSVHYGAPRAKVVEALKRAAAQRDASAHELRLTMNNENSKLPIYVSFRRIADRERLTAEARTLRRLARYFGRADHGKTVPPASARKHR